MSNLIRMDSLPNLQFQANSLMLMQMLPHNLQLTHLTPDAGRPQASRRAGAGEKKTLRTKFLKFPDWGVT